MSGRAVGGYVRRGDRRYTAPVPDDGIPRCGYCRARLDLGMYPHLCKEVIFQSAPLLSFVPFGVADEPQA